MSRSHKSLKCIESFHIPPPEDRLPEGMTRRAALCIYLYIHEGWSYQDIASAINYTDWTVRADVGAAKRILALAVESRGYPFIERFFSLWRDGEQQRKPHYVALRHDRLAQDLEQRTAQRSKELADVSECMGANRTVPHKRSKGPAWTQWETRYLNETGRASIPLAAYGPKSKRGRLPSRFCASDPATCNLSCSGCRGIDA